MAPITVLDAHEAQWYPVVSQDPLVFEAVELLVQLGVALVDVVGGAKVVQSDAQASSKQDISCRGR